MWYTVLKKEMTVNGVTAKAGTIYTAKKVELFINEGWVQFTALDEQVAQLKETALPQRMCKDWFTKPTKDLDSAMEESFMVCEAVYC